MADLNKVMILGNVGREPELRYTANGNAMASFTVATNRSRRLPDDSWEKETEWFTVVAWRQLAERISQSLQKGSRVYVEGRMATRSWDGSDGTKKYRTELIADHILPQGPSQAAQTRPVANVDPAGWPEMTDPDDLPFD